MQLVINAPPVPSFTLAATPASNTVTVGGSATYTVTSTATGGFTGGVTLAASPAIAGVTYSFGTNPVAATGSSTFTCATASTAVAGTYTITLTGTSGTLTRTATVTLVIAPPAGTNPVKTYTAAAALAIPDNNTTGVTSTINVPLGLTVTSVSVSTVIPHTYKGDLIVTLIAPDNTSRILHNRTGAATDNVTTTFSIVTVTDNAAGDTGTLSSWSITFNGERALTANTAIPDNNTTGITSTQTFTQTGTVAAVKIRCNVTHTYKGDLEIALIAPDNTTVLLHNRTGAATDNVNTVFPDLTAPAQALSAFTGKSINGAWKLRVRDLSAADTGSLVSWTLSLQAQ
jgi:subtilisin-like proprotein convertase family protein